MKQIIFVTFVVLLIVQMIPTAEPFIIKTVSFQKAIPSPEAVSSIIASKNDLINTVSKAVTEKINTLTSLVNNVVQLKIAAKQDLLRTKINAGNAIVNTVNGILVAKPTVFTKTVTVGFKPLYTTTLLPATSTATSGVVTTTSGQSGAYKYGRRFYRY